VAVGYSKFNNILTFTSRLYLHLHCHYYGLLLCKDPQTYREAREQNMELLSINEIGMFYQLSFTTFRVNKAQETS
jgi:hypothetical protein